MDKAPAPPVHQSFSSHGSGSTDDYHRHSSRQQDYDSTKDYNPGATATTPSNTSKHRSDASGNEASTHDEDGGKDKSKSPSHPLPPIRRRNRMIKSCLECRRRKLKCDKSGCPCTNCAKSKRDCVFMAPALDSKSKMKLAELKEKMGSLERVLEDDVAERGFGAHEEGGVKRGKGKQTEEYEEYRSYEGGAVGSSRGRRDENSGEGRFEDAPVPDDEAFLEPTHIAFQDAAYEGEADDDVYDLGFRFGKMTMTDRVGGLVRPKFNEEITQTLKGLPGMPSDEEQDMPAKPSPRLRDLLSTGKDSCFSPGPSCIAPRSDLFFGAESLRKHTYLDFLPSRDAVDNLIQRYWESVHTIAKVVHRPSFEKRYDSFWEDVSRGNEPPPSLQAVVFAAMLSAVISMSETLVLSTFGVRQKGLVENFQLGTEMALGKAHFLKTTKTETLQALVMYLIPMCRSEISRAHSALVGAAIRLAECMGFHRDPSEYDLPPVETHVRRMIWYQLCYLDVRTGEIQGPRPTIHRRDFSTRFPLNVDDSDLLHSTTDSFHDMPRWTDMTFTRVRLEYYEFVRIIYADNSRLDRKTVSLTCVLGKIESFRKASYAKYWPLINSSNQKPVQRACGLMLSILIASLYVIVLQRYYAGVSVRIPDRLRQIIILKGIQQLEYSIEFETTPDLKNWNWYIGAFQQYQIALLLLCEISMYPMRREAHRIWRCLDFIYEVSPLPPRSDSDADRDITLEELMEYRIRKGVIILTQIRDRLNTYRDLRKLKIPVRMRDKHLYIRRSAPGMGGDVMASKPEDIQRAEKGRDNTGEGTEGQTSRSQFPRNAVLPLTTAFLSNSPNLPYPTQPTQDSQPVVFQHQPPTQSHLYPESQNQPPHLYQPQAQSNHQFYPPLQQLSQHLGPLAWGLGYDAAPATQSTAYGQGPVHRSSDRDRNVESDTENVGDSDDFGLWFMSNTKTPGAGTAPTAPPYPVPPPEDEPMVEIDWNEWDELFPPEINNGDLNMPIQSMEDQPISMDTSFDGFLFPNPAYVPRQ